MLTYHLPLRYSSFPKEENRDSTDFFRQSHYNRLNNKNSMYANKVKEDSCRS